MSDKDESDTAVTVILCLCAAVFLAAVVLIVTAPLWMH